MSYPYIGQNTIHPTELIYTKHMLYDERELPTPSDRDENAGTTMLRARYRGPFESYKFNKNKADINRDLRLITQQLGKERERLIDTIALLMYTKEYPVTINYIDIPEDGSANSIRHYSTSKLKTSTADLQRLIDESSERMQYWTVNLK